MEDSYEVNIEEVIDILRPMKRIPVIAHWKKSVVEGLHYMIDSGETTMSDVKNIIMPSNSDTLYSEGLKHPTIEIKCNYCKGDFVVEISKTRLIDYLTHCDIYNGYACKECTEKRKEDEKRKRKIREQEILNEQENATKEYIDNYLNPNNAWKKGVKTYVKMQELRNHYIDHNSVASYIRSMNYRDFLQTPYWKAISENVKKKAGFKCNLCGGNYKLSTHHRDYTIHGRELDNQKELICICSNCHSKFHNELGE